MGELSGSKQWEEAMSLLQDHGSLAATLSTKYNAPPAGASTVCALSEGPKPEVPSRDEGTASPPYRWERLDESMWRLRVYDYERAADVELDITETHVRLTPVSAPNQLPLQFNLQDIFGMPADGTAAIARFIKQGRGGE